MKFTKKDGLISLKVEVLSVVDNSAISMKIISDGLDDPNIKTIKLKLSIIDNGVGISKEGL